MEKEAFESPSIKVANFTYFLLILFYDFFYITFDWNIFYLSDT